MCVGDFRGNFTSLRRTFLFEFSPILLWCFFQVGSQHRAPVCQPCGLRAEGIQPGRQWFLTSMTDTLEMCIVHRASHHCSPTGRHLQAAGVSFAGFLQKLMALKTLSNVSCCHTAEKENYHQVLSGSGQILQKGCKETMRQLQLERKTNSSDQRAHPRCQCCHRVYCY